MKASLLQAPSTQLLSSASSQVVARRLLNHGLFGPKSTPACTCVLSAPSSPISFDLQRYTSPRKCSAAVDAALMHLLSGRSARPSTSTGPGTLRRHTLYTQANPSVAQLDCPLKHISDFNTPTAAHIFSAHSKRNVRTPRSLLDVQPCRRHLPPLPIPKHFVLALRLSHAIVSHRKAVHNTQLQQSKEKPHTLLYIFETEAEV